jgi:threonine/homoserine/homoserine lactone efflux protein
MSLSGLIGYSCALAIAAIIPGPQIFATVGQALRRGFGRAASGMVVTLGNPKSVLFYISIMPTIVNLRSITQMAGLALLAITGTILLAAQLPFAVAAARTRHLFRLPKRLRLINRSAAVCMGGAAAAVALRK